MKAISVFLIFIFSQYLVSQNLDWARVNPNPQNDFYAIKFFDQNTGYVVGSGGVILKNTTGSNNWINVPGGTINNLYGLYFFDVNHGYIVGENSMIMYTSNGGVSWLSSFTPGGGKLRSITFVNQLTGFAAGDNGTIFMTTTGMSGWIPSVVTSYNLRCICFPDSQNGYACGDSGKFIRTTNGGANWSVQNVGTNNLASVYFTSALTGYLIANPNGSCKTTDGGVSWSPIYLGYSASYNSIKFVNQNTGFAVGSNAPILRTTNAGLNWSYWCSSQIGGNLDFYDISPVDTNIAFVSGSKGWLLKSTGNISSQSAQHIGGSKYNLSYVSFLNESTGFVRDDCGHFLRTTSGGTNWSVYLTGLNSWFEGGYSITSLWSFAPSSVYRYYFISGHASPTSFVLENSSDGGLTWNGVGGYSQNPSAFGGISEVQGVKYLSSGGYPSPKQVLKNTGSGWSVVFNSINVTLGALSFSNQNTGAVLTSNNAAPGIYRTSDAGGSWAFIPTGLTTHVYNIQFLQSGTCFLSGDSSLIMKSTDFGLSWSLLQRFGNEYIIDLQFVNDNTGWYTNSTGSFPYINRLYLTQNGGASFQQLQSLISFNVKGFSFVNAYTGYVCGDSGVVLKTTNGGLTFVNPQISNVPESFNLSQNYPNPFNPSTKISFNIPVGNGRDRSVKLTIYDALGREITTLVNEQLQPGEYSVTWDASAYPSGVYFYKLEAGEYIPTRKMVLIK